MTETELVCDGCGTKLVDGGVDWYCPNDACSFEADRAKVQVAHWLEQRQRAEYERLREIYEPETIREAELRGMRRMQTECAALAKAQEGGWGGYSDADACADAISRYIKAIPLTLGGSDG